MELGGSYRDRWTFGCRSAPTDMSASSPHLDKWTWIDYLGDANDSVIRHDECYGSPLQGLCWGQDLREVMKKLCREGSFDGELS